DWTDLSLNIISLSGLTLAVGMVVDDAVVVLENIFRFKEEGYDHNEASILGAQEVAVPVVISTLTTLVVFIPILFVPCIAGFLFRDLALSISFALSISSLVDLSLIPMMSSQLLNTSNEDEEQETYLKSLLIWSHSIIWKRILAAPLLLVFAIFYSLLRFFRWIVQRLTSFFSTRIGPPITRLDRKSTRLNSSHDSISYAVFCLKKKNIIAE